MDILLQTIISELSIKAPKDPKKPLQLDFTTIEGVAAIFAIRRFGWPMATLLLAPAEGWGTLRVPRTSIVVDNSLIKDRVNFKFNSGFHV